MTIQQLIYFQKAAQEESITKAAELLYISQPALSRSIGKLEEELECDLLQKNGRSVKLTPYGKALYKRAENMLAEFEELKSDLAGIRAQSQKNVTIAAPSKLMQSDLLEMIYRRDPDIQLNLVDRRAKDRVSEFLRGDIDLYVSEVPIERDNLSTKTLLKESLGIMLSSKHPLAGRPEISLFDLKDDSFVVYPKGRLIRDRLDEIFEKNSFSPKREIECETIIQAIPYIMTGRSVTVFPLWAIRAFEKENPMICGSLLKENDYSKTLCLQWDNGRTLSSAVKTVRDEIIEYYK